MTGSRKRKRLGELWLDKAAKVLRKREVRTLKKKNRQFIKQCMDVIER